MASKEFQEIQNKLMGFDWFTYTPPRPDKPSTNSILHPMYKDLDGRFWPIVIQQVELGAILTDDIAKWDIEVDGELF